MTTFLKAKKIDIFYNPNIKINYSDYFQIDLTKDKSIKKILIIKWGGMGDIIQSTAIINDILENFKSSKIHVNTRPAWKELFSNEKRIANVWGFNFRKNIFALKDILKWVGKVNAEKYDLIIDLQTNDRSRIVLTLLKFLFLSKSKLIGNHPIFPYSNVSKKAAYGSINLMQRTIASIGIMPKNIKPIIKLNKKNKEKAKTLMRKNGLLNNNFFIFIPGASKGNMLKRWGVKNFLELAKLLNKTVVLIGGADDLDDCHMIAQENNTIVNLCGKTTLLELLEIFKNCSYIIGNDTGTLHLASATNVPTIQIAGPTNPLLVKPSTNNVISVQADIDCKNCYQKNCSHHSCMKNITADYIYSIIKDTK